MRSVAAETGTDPIDLAPLGDVVDPDALDALYASLEDGDRGDDREYELRFSYAGLVVSVRSGEVAVEQSPPATG